MKKDAVEAIEGHFRRQATSEVWAEVDDLRCLFAQTQGALVRALTEVGCLHEEKCPHWVEWHNSVRAAIRPDVLAEARAKDRSAQAPGLQARPEGREPGPKDAPNPSRR